MTSNIINKKSFFENSIVNLKSFILLMKPRVMSLVIFTCAVGLLTAPESVTFYNSVVSIFFVAIGAGAAGALNMWYEADLDKLMTRTCLRPIPTGKLNKNHQIYNDKNLGSIEQGKEATFFISTDDALDIMKNNVEHIFIKGEAIDLVNHQSKLYQKYKERKN